MPDLIGPAIDMGMGLMTNQMDRMLQVSQQRKLQALQIQGMKEMGQYNYEKQMQLWKATNYPAQIGMMKEAGLNPALMYKGSGPGGTTAFTGGGGITGATAGMELGNQIMQRAQIRLMESQANKLDAEAAKTSGIDTKVAEATLSNIAQQTQNLQSQKELIEIETDIKRIMEYVAGKTQNMAVDLIQQELLEAHEKVKQMVRENRIGNATEKDIIATIHAQMLGEYLKNKLTKAQTVNTTEDTQLKIQQVISLSNKVAQDWLALEYSGTHQSAERHKMESDQWVNELHAVTGLPIDMIKGAVQAILLKGIISPAGNAPIKGFHDRK